MLAYYPRVRACACQPCVYPAHDTPFVRPRCEDAVAVTRPLKAAGFRQGDAFVYNAFRTKQATDPELRKRYALLFRDYLRASQAQGVKRGHAYARHRRSDSGAALGDGTARSGDIASNRWRGWV
jgi:hypothetical protein